MREPERMTPAWPATWSCVSRFRRISSRGVSVPDTPPDISARKGVSREREGQGFVCLKERELIHEAAEMGGNDEEEVPPVV